MSISSRCISTGSWALLVAGLCFPASAKDLNLSTLTLKQSDAITLGADVIADAQWKLDEIIWAAEDETVFESEERCLTTLQAAVNTGAIVANAFPFSSVRVFEDERGPVGRFRMLTHGQKRHLDAFCAGSTLMSNELPWGDGASEPDDFSPTSLDAASGLLLMLIAQSTPAAKEAVVTPAAPAFAPITPDSDDLSPGEWTALRVGIQQCWNVGSLSSEALRTAVTVGFSITPDRRPIPDSIRMIDSSGGDESAARQAFESARRAIIRCGANGLKVPVGKYDIWKDIALTFDPSTMRLR